MERSSFFDATLVGETYDRVYLADDFARYFASFIGNGVFPTPSTNLQVVQDVNMQVKLKAGKGWINGRFYELTEDLTLNVAVADGVLKRKDRVVLRLDFINREIKAYLKKGAFSSSPVAPTLTRDADIYELGIADILINNGVTSITQANITDLRQNNTYCGLVAGVVQQIDTTNLFAQFQTAFDVWFEAVKGQLSTDAAGNLQNQIDLIQPLVDSWEDFKDNGGTLFNSLTINNLNTLTDQIKTSKNNLTIGLEGTSTGYNMSKTSFAPNFLSIGDNPVLGRIEYPWQDLILRNIGSVKDRLNFKIVQINGTTAASGATNIPYPVSSTRANCYFIGGHVLKANNVGDSVSANTFSYGFNEMFFTAVEVSRPYSLLFLVLG